MNPAEVAALEAATHPVRTIALPDMRAAAAQPGALMRLTEVTDAAGRTTYIAVPA